MDDYIVVALLIVSGLMASVLSAVRGFGGAMILLPVLVAVFGVQDAVPILTVAKLLGNASRAWFNRREVAWPVVGWFTLGSVLAGIVGGILLVKAPLPLLTRLIGRLLLLVVVYRHVKKPGERRMRQWWFVPIRSVGNFLSALVSSAGRSCPRSFWPSGWSRGRTLARRR